MLDLVLVNAVEGLKYENFQKIKLTPPGIHPIYNCTKFQHYCTIFYFSRLPRSFREKRVL